MTIMDQSPLTAVTVCELLRVQEIAVRLRVSVRGARDLLAAAERAGEIVRVVLSPRRVRWDASAVERWLTRRVQRAQRDAARRARLLSGSPEPELPSPQARRRRARTPPPLPPASPPASS